MDIDYDKLGASVAENLHRKGHPCNLDPAHLSAVSSVAWAKQAANASDEDIANSYRLGQSMSKSSARNINRGGKLLFYAIGAVVAVLTLFGLGKWVAPFVVWVLTK